MSENIDTESIYILDLVEINQILENVKKLEQFIDRNTITDLESLNEVSEEELTEIQTTLFVLESVRSASSSSPVKEKIKIDSLRNNENNLSKMFVSIQTVLQFLSEIIQRNTERNQDDTILNALIELNEIVNIALSKTDFNIEIMRGQSNSVSEPSETDQNIVQNPSVSNKILFQNSIDSSKGTFSNLNIALNGDVNTQLDNNTLFTSANIQKPIKPIKPSMKQQLSTEFQLNIDNDNSGTSHVLPPLPPPFRDSTSSQQPSSNKNVNFSGFSLDLPAGQSAVATGTSINGSSGKTSFMNDSHNSFYNQTPPGESISKKGSYINNASGFSEKRKSVISHSQGSSDMRHIMYMLRRMGDRQQCLTAVNLLITKLSHYDVKTTLNEMREAEALKTLLTALSKSSDWPEVELYLSKAICILVTHEDDAGLILKSANEILSLLHMLQVKLMSSKREGQMKDTLNTSTDSVFIHLRSSLSSSSSSSINPSPLKNMESPSTPKSNNNSNNNATLLSLATEMRGLISTTLATIVSVLCNEWRNNGDIQQLIALGTSSMNLTKTVDVNMRPDRARSSATAQPRHSSSTDSVSGIPVNHNHNINKAFAMNLESVINIIMLICEQPANLILKNKLPWSRSTSQNSSTGIERSSSGVNASITLHSGYDNKSRSRRNSSALSTTPNNSSSSASSTHKIFFPANDPNSLNNSIDLTNNNNSHGHNHMPISISSFINIDIDINLLNEYIDDACTIVSASLSELAELPQCRPGIISGGALTLLKNWIENGTDIIMYYKYKLFDYKQKSRRFSRQNPDLDNELMNSTNSFRDYNIILNRLSRLLSNATCAIMLILGGSSDVSKLILTDNTKAISRETSASPRGAMNQARELLSVGLGGNNNNNNNIQKNSQNQIYGYEYMIGRIDAQIINENIPNVLVHFITSMTTTLFDEFDYIENDYVDDEECILEKCLNSETDDDTSSLMEISSRTESVNTLHSNKSSNKSSNSHKNTRSFSNISNISNISFLSPEGIPDGHTRFSFRSEGTGATVDTAAFSLNMYVSEPAESRKASMNISNANSPSFKSDSAIFQSIIENPSPSVPTTPIISHNSKSSNTVAASPKVHFKTNQQHQSNNNSDFEIIREFIKKAPNLKKNILNRLKEVGLSKLVMIYLAQALFQLSSRNQNRHNLLSLQVPQVVLMLLTEAVAEAEKLGPNLEANDTFLKNFALKTTSPSIATGSSADLDSMGHTSSVSASISGSSNVNPNHNENINHKVTSPKPKGMARSSSHSPERNQLKIPIEKTINYEDYADDILEILSSTWNCNECCYLISTSISVMKTSITLETSSSSLTQKFVYNSLFLSNIWKSNSNNSGKVSNEIKCIKTTDIDTISFLKTVSSSCLDTIFCFLNDAVLDPAPFSQGMTTGVNVNPLAVSASATCDNIVNSNSDKTQGVIKENNYSFEESCGNVLIDETCSDKSIKNIKFLLTFLPHCPARHSALKITSALSQWHKGLSALKKGHIFECLMVISKQLEWTHLTKEKHKKEREREKEQLMIQSIHAEQEANNVSGNSNNPFHKLMRNSRTRALGNLGTAREGKMTGRLVTSRLETIPQSSESLYDSMFLRNSRNRNETVEQHHFKLMKPKNDRGTSLQDSPSFHSLYPGQSEPTTPPLLGFGLEKPNLRRMVSDGSEISNTSYNSFQSNSLFPTRSILDPVKVPPLLMRGVSNSSGNSDSMFSELYDFPHSSTVFDKKYEKNNALLEETVAVCYTLANICQAQESFAIQLLEMGLLVTMTNLCYISTNTINISNTISLGLRMQALRCISSTSYLLSKVDLNELLKVYKMKSKRFLNTILNALVSALKFQNTSIQREAIYGIAGLALDEHLHEAIMGDPLQIIMKLILDRNHYDRDTRAYAENVVKNIGFHDGLRDLELIGFDLDVLRDWYKIIQLLKPQEKCSTRLKAWVFDLFEGNEFTYLGEWADDADDYDHFNSFKGSAVAYSTTSRLEPWETNTKSSSALTTPDRHYQSYNVNRIAGNQFYTIPLAIDGKNANKGDRDIGGGTITGTSSTVTGEGAISLPRKNSDSHIGNNSSPRTPSATVGKMRNTYGSDTTVKSLVINTMSPSRRHSSKLYSDSYVPSNLITTPPIDTFPYLSDLNNSKIQYKDKDFVQSKSSVITTVSNNTPYAANASPTKSKFRLDPIGQLGPIGFRTGASPRDNSPLNSDQNSAMSLDFSKSVNTTYIDKSASEKGSGRDTGSNSSSSLTKPMKAKRHSSGSMSPMFSNYFKSFYRKTPPPIPDQANRQESNDTLAASVRTSGTGNTSSSFLSRIFNFRLSNKQLTKNHNIAANSSSKRDDMNDNSGSRRGSVNDEYFKDYFENIGYDSSASVYRIGGDKDNEMTMKQSQNSDTDIAKFNSNNNVNQQSYDLQAAQQQTSNINATSSGFIASILSPVIMKSSNTPSLTIDASTPTAAGSAGPGVLDMLLDSPTVKYTGIDVPPAGVINMLNIYSPSKLSQLFYMDLVSLQPDRVFSSSNDLIKDRSIDFYHTPLEQLLVQLPLPFPIYGIFFQPSKYSFRRIARVIEKVIEERNNLERELNNDFSYTKYRRWSLAFRDDSFPPEVMTDFYQNVTQFLSKCPQIVSLSFTASNLITCKSPHYVPSKQPEQNAHMGHMAGNVPPNIRFLAFKGVLSSASIQALCIILKRCNVAFSEELEEAMSPNSSTHNMLTSTSLMNNNLSPTISPRDTSIIGAPPLPGYSATPVSLQRGRSGSNASEAYSRTSSNNNGNIATDYVGYTSSPRSLLTPSPRDNTTSVGIPTGRHHEYHYRNPLKPQAGLIGLAITHTNLTPKDIEKVMELLAIYASSKFFKNLKKANNSGHGNSVNTNSNEKSRQKDNNNHSSNGSGLHGPNPKGLRYLDLSNNKLNDNVCAEVLNASQMGPLEGLDLSTNNIKSGKEFIEVLSKITPADNFSFLRHLGLSNNNLSNKAVCQILECIETSNSITSLDVSLNGITSNQLFEKSLETFLKHNESLRILDLGFNKLGTSTVEKIYLGLEENDKGSLLMLPLIGNHDMIKSPNFSLVQRKLSDNRKNYKKNMNRYNDSIRRYKEYLLEEDEFNRQQIILQEQQLFNKSVASLVPDFNKGNQNHASIDKNDSIAEAVDTARLDSHLLYNPYQNINETLSLRREKEESNLHMPNDSKNIVTELTSLDSNQNMLNYEHSLSPIAVATAVYSSSTAHSPVTATVVATSDVTVNLKSLSDRQNSNVLSLASLSRSVSDSTNPHSTTPASIAKKDMLEYISPGALQLDTISNPSSGSNRQLSTNESRMNELSERDSEQTQAVIRSNSESTSNGIQLNRSNSGGNADIPSFNVFFSAPLVWRDKAGKHHPLEILDYDSERDAITKLLTEVHRDISVSFQFATTDSLRTALSLGCRALHFSGHGHPQFLNFEDGRAGLQKIPVEVLRGLLRAGGLKLDFVFVSACHSRKIGEAFIEAGVPHVVCVTVEAMIQDAAAQAFTRAFYLALFTGKTVQASFDIAKRALESAPYVPDGVLEGEKFILLPEPDERYSGQLWRNSQATGSGTGKYGVHDRYIFKCKPVDYWPSVKAGHIRMGANRTNYPSIGTSMLSSYNLSVSFDGVCGSSGSFFGCCNSSLPSPPPDFEGREVDMYKIISTLLNRRLISLNGSSGVGKTAVTISVCTYVSDRSMFADGVFYFRTRDISSWPVFLDKFIRGLFNGPPKVAEVINQTRLGKDEYIAATSTIIPKSINSKHMLNTNDNNMDSNTITNNNNPTSMRPDGIIFNREDLIITSLSLLNVLLVFDHIDDLLDDDSSSMDFKFFLSSLFDRCPNVKILITCVDSLDKHNITNLGVVEHKIHLGALTLRSSIRLYARLASSLLTSTAKQNFISSLLPDNPIQHHVTYNSREITKQSAQILELFSNGHPAEIFKLACESTYESVELLMIKGKRILNNHNQGNLSHDTFSKLQHTHVSFDAAANNNNNNNQSRLSNHTTHNTSMNFTPNSISIMQQITPSTDQSINLVNTTFDSENSSKAILFNNTTFNSFNNSNHNTLYSSPTTPTNNTNNNTNTNASANNTNLNTFSNVSNREPNPYLLFDDR